jgi:hypothetical protein
LRLTPGFTSNTGVFAHNYSGGYGSGSIYYKDGGGTLPRTVTLQINERAGRRRQLD